MCGIAGIISTESANVHLALLKKMTDAIDHRGPDGEAFWINPVNTVGFGHRRLAVIDLSPLGNQPMHYLDRYTIVFNGEIYNYVELKRDLEKKGYQFTSRSDTEVILAAYACYGRSCLQYFDGMFAFAIWDDALRELFAARDRFGEKPFYYTLPDGADTLIFASEMKALWQAGVPRYVDLTMMLNFITLGHVQNPTDKAATFYKGIQSLAPAHWLIYHLPDNKLTVSRYYEVSGRDTEGLTGHGDLQGQFLQLFQTSVGRRLRSDVPVGTSLSGGLDSSSIVVATISQLRANENSQAQGKLAAFSAIFPGFQHDESRYIGMMAEKFNIETYFISPDADDLLNDFERMCFHQEEPFQSASIYAQFKVFELARNQQVTVLLDGQGADEILAGYHRYLHWFLQEMLAEGKYSLLAKELKAFRDHNIDIEWGWKNYLATCFPAIAASHLKKREIDHQQNHPDITGEFLRAHANVNTIFKPVVHCLDDMLAFNIACQGLEELLRYADRNSMAHGREVRLPFLNHELVAFCLALPSTSKIANGFTKRILRESMNETLPKEITWRTDKVGYEPPQDAWMANKTLQEYLHEAKQNLVNQRLLKPGVLNKNYEPLRAHAANNFDWRYLVASAYLPAH